MRSFLVLSLLLLVSCAPSSWEDLRAEGEAETRHLAELLRPIDTKEELMKQLPKIKKSYLKMADLVVQVREMGAIEESEPSLASDALFSELARLYEMPGCRALIESAQQDALALLSK